MFSSVKQDWETPQQLFDKYNEEYNFIIDLAASSNNAKCSFYFDESDDSLSKNWTEWCTDRWGWVNPPYGLELPKWVKKCFDEMLLGAKIVALIPARTETKYFHKYIWDKKTGQARPGILVEFLEGRVTFGSDNYWQWVWEQEYINGKENKLYKKYGKKNTAPFPSMIVIFNK